MQSSSSTNSPFVNSHLKFEHLDVKDHPELVNKETCKVTGLVMEIFQNTAKIFDYSHVQDLVNRGRQGYQWIQHTKSACSGDLKKALQQNVSDVMASPKNFVSFLSAFRSLAEWVSIPLGIAIKNEALPENMIDILKYEHKNMVETCFNIKIPERWASTEDVFSRVSSDAATPQEKQKLTAEKVNSLLEVIGILSVSFNATQLASCTALISSLTKSYIFYLEKTNKQPEELFQLLKAESELTLKMQLQTLPMSFTESKFASEMAIEDKLEILEEIQQIILSYLDLLSNSTNDSIFYEDLKNYQGSINNLYSVYDIELEGFNNKLEEILKKCEPLRVHRENMEHGAGQLLENYQLFLGDQLSKLTQFYGEFEEKLNKNDFQNFIKPQFEKIAEDLTKESVATESYLVELRSDKFGVVPFTLFSLSERKDWYTEIMQICGDERKEDTMKAVNRFGREI